MSSFKESEQKYLLRGFRMTSEAPVWTAEAAVLVRLRVSMHRRVRVPLWRSFLPVTESNCVVATRGGEQLEVNG